MSNNHDVTPIRSVQTLVEQLTDEQQQAAQLLVEGNFSKIYGLKKHTYEEVAEAAGISDKTLRRWRNDQKFIEYQSYVTSLYSASLRPLVEAQLMKAIIGNHNGQPSVKAIELWLKLQGILIDKKEMTYIDSSIPKLTQAQIDSTVADLASRISSIQRR